MGSPLELYERPANLFVAGFIGSPKMNFLDAELVAATSEMAQVQLPNGARLTAHVDASRAQPGCTRQAGHPPEHFERDQAENALGAVVSFVESLGGETVAYCEIDGTNTALTCSFDGRTRLRSGQALALSLPAACCHLFDEAGVAFPRARPPRIERSGAELLQRQGRAGQRRQRVGDDRRGNRRHIGVEASFGVKALAKFRLKEQLAQARHDAATDDAATRTLDQGDVASMAAEQRAEGLDRLRTDARAAVQRLADDGFGRVGRHILGIAQRFTHGAAQRGQADTRQETRSADTWRKDLRATASTSPSKSLPRRQGGMTTLTRQREP